MIVPCFFLLQVSAIHIFLFNVVSGYLCNKCFGRILLEQFIASAATICAVGQIFNLRKQIISCREGGRGGQPWATQASLRVHMVHKACSLQLDLLLE